MIMLMGIHSFMNIVLWIPTAFLLAVTFIHLISGGYNSSLKFCGSVAFSLVAASYILVHSVLEDPWAFYGVGILLFLIFSSRNDLSLSGTHRSTPIPDTGQKFHIHHDYKGLNDIPVAGSKLPHLEDIEEVSKGMLRLPVIHKVDSTDSTEAILLVLGRRSDGEQHPATGESVPRAHPPLPSVIPQIDSAPDDVRAATLVQRYTSVDTTVAPTLSPIIVIAEIAPGHQIVASSSRHSIGDLLPKHEPKHVTNFRSGNATILADSSSGNGWTETTVEQPVDSDTRENSTAQGHVRPDVEGSVVVIDSPTTAFANSTTVFEGSIDEHSGTSLSSMIDTSGSNQSMNLIISDSVRSAHTAPSSDGGVNIEAYNTVLIQEHEGRGFKEVIPAIRSQILETVNARELARLLEVHDCPAFHEGPLHEVYDLVWLQRVTNVCSIYNADDSKSCLWELGSNPDRPVADDAKDIMHMLQDVWQTLSARQQLIISNAGLHEYYRRRDGMTGSNFFIRDLEISWHQKYPPVFNGHVIEVLDLSMIMSYEMARTRAYRPAYRHGTVTYTGLHATHRQYLTDVQEITVNEGCSDYAVRTEQAAQSEMIRGLETHLNHAGARNKNSVPGWLDATVGYIFYDPNAYLPCICGSKARQAHLESRNGIEPGYNSSLHGCKESPPALLGEEALEEDRKRKAQDDRRREGLPRSQDFAQECPLHAILTNNPWILMDGIENPNDLLIGMKGELPAPGFTIATAYPAGFRMPYGFLKADPTTLPPRCEHGYPHPPFVDACMRCFPTGEHDGDCAECDKHSAVKAIKQDPKMEDIFMQACQRWDDLQMGHMRRGIMHQKRMIELWQGVVAEYYHGWPVLTDI